MIQLFVEPVRKTPRILIRWETSQTLVDDLVWRRNAKNVHVLISITTSHEEVKRKLVPFKNGKTLVKLPEPGTYNVYAIIVWHQHIHMLFQDTLYANTYSTKLGLPSYSHDRHLKFLEGFVSPQIELRTSVITLEPERFLGWPRRWLRALINLTKRL